MKTRSQVAHGYATKLFTDIGRMDLAENLRMGLQVGTLCIDTSLRRAEDMSMIIDVFIAAYTRAGLMCYREENPTRIVPGDNFREQLQETHE